ncbi:MAG: ATP-binding cassette domain-containing protein [Bacilli bacterium]|nr:ATP-binding cassette domain-containing protein [Bacilli bacterium]
MEVRIEHLTKTFIGKKGSKTTAVNDMSFVVPDGKLVGLLGPSGCGKSTTLYMIAGLHKPTDGHIWFGDEDVTNVPPENRGIGLVFQNYALYPHFSVKQNITFPLDNVRFPHPLQSFRQRVAEAKVAIKKAQKALAKAQKEQADADLTAFIDAETAAQNELAEAEEALKKAGEELEQIKVNDPERYAKITKKKLTAKEKDEIAHKMARLVDIEPYLERKPKELSGGQQQRVAIARALAKSPRVLLLDEPLSNLDARLRLQTREEIRRIQKETGITTIFVTHDQEEAMSISDVIVVMNFGVIQQIDEPQKVYDDPVNLFVAKFLGSPAINIFDGEIKNGKLYVDDHIFDEDPVYKKEHHGTIAHEMVYVKGTKKTAEEYQQDIVNDHSIIKGLRGKAREKALNPELEVVMEYEEVVRTDRIVKIGVRPEAFTLDPKGRIPLEVEAVQRVGRDISALGTVKGQTSHLKVIIPVENWQDVVGKDALKFSPKKFYVFEESGERIK